MNNWLEIKDGEDAICIYLDKLQQVSLKGDVLHCFYENKGSVESEYLNPAAARAAYGSLLAQLRGQPVPKPPLTRAEIMAFLRDDSLTEQKPSPPLVPVRKNPTDEMPGEAAVRQKVEAFVAATEAPPPMPSTPPRLIPVPPSPHIDGCPCEECARNRHVENNPKCECFVCTAKRRDAEEKPPQPALPLENIRFELTVEKKEDIVRQARKHASGEPNDSVALLNSIMVQLRELESKNQPPAQPVVVPSEEELCKIVDEALTFAEGHAQYVDIIARRIRRQLLERQPKREELSEEQILKLTIEAYEFGAQGQKWHKAPERYQESWIARIKNLLRQLREAGRLL